MSERCPQCDISLNGAGGHDPEQCIAELRDQREGLNAALDTLMRALKVALKQHNELMASETLLRDALNQAEDEFEETQEALKKERRALHVLESRISALTRERDEARDQLAALAAPGS